MADFRIETERLVLRAWQVEDAPALQAICSDARVMEFLGPPQSRADVEAAIERQWANQARFGHCYWALEDRRDGRMIGFCGLQPMASDMPDIGGKTDIGWRLAHSHWGQGFAREAAGASLDWGFEHLFIYDILAITVPANERSWGLMERLGMERRDELAFAHPALADEDPLKPHIVYSISRDKWTKH